MSTNIVSFIASHLGDDSHAGDELFDSMLQTLSITLSNIDDHNSRRRVAQEEGGESELFVVRSFIAVTRVVLEKRCAMPNWRMEMPLPDPIRRAWTERARKIITAESEKDDDAAESFTNHNNNKKKNFLLLVLLLFAPDSTFDNVVDLQALEEKIATTTVMIEFHTHCRNVVDAVRNRTSFVHSFLGNECALVFAKQLLFSNLLDDTDTDDGTTKKRTMIPPLLLRGTILSLCNEQCLQRHAAAALAVVDARTETIPGSSNNTVAPQQRSTAADKVSHQRANFSSVCADRRRRVYDLSSSSSQHPRPAGVSSSLWNRVASGLDIKSFLSSSPTLRYLLVLCSSLQFPVTGHIRARLCNWLSSITPADPAMRADINSCVLGLLLIQPMTATATAAAGSQNDDDNPNNNNNNDNNNNNNDNDSTVSLENDVWIVQSCFQHQLRQKRRPGSNAFSIDLLKLDEDFVYAGVPSFQQGGGVAAAAGGGKRGRRLLSRWVVSAISSPLSILRLTARGFGQEFADGSDPLCVSSAMWLFRLFAELASSSSSDDEDDYFSSVVASTKISGEGHDDEGGVANSAEVQEGVETAIRLSQAFFQHLLAQQQQQQYDPASSSSLVDLHDAVRAWLRWKSNMLGRNFLKQNNNNENRSALVMMMPFITAVDHWLWIWFLLQYQQYNEQREYDNDAAAGSCSCCEALFSAAGWAPQLPDFLSLSSSPSSTNNSIYDEESVGLQLEPCFRAISDTLRLVVDGATSSSSGVDALVLPATTAGILDRYLMD